MSDYSRQNDFTAKDALLTGNPLKAIKGVDIDEELDEVVTAVASKMDKSGGTFTGDVEVNASMTWQKGSDVASAATLPINVAGNIFDVTGTTTVTALASKGVGTIVVLQFDAALTLTHSATDLILPAGENITTSAGDVGVFVEYASGDWLCVSYRKASVSVGGTFTDKFTSADQTITAGGQLTIAHGLGIQPTHVQTWLKCTNAGGANGYANNDEFLCFGGPQTGSADRGCSIIVDSTNITVRFGSASNTFNVINASSGSREAITNSNYAFIVKAWV